ncbi:MAG: hypothetical protein CSB15_01820 [Clostridiales bacterium]|nr:MAG: hypothetical protein CSB15_01820 [Clostridiales bacterium]
MDNILEKYLKNIYKYLGNMPTSEKIDIISELKSQILDMKNEQNLSSREIVNHFGCPKRFANSYLNETITKDDDLSFNKIMSIISYWSISAIGVIAIIPCAAICAITFIACGVITPIAGLLKLIAYLMGSDIPEIGVFIPGHTVHPSVVFIMCLVLGAILLVLGILCWKLMIRYIRYIENKK